MTWEEFAEMHNFRELEKSCENCKHGSTLYDDGWECLHPLIDAEKNNSMFSPCSICDLWEPEPEYN